VRKPWIPGSSPRARARRAWRVGIGLSDLGRCPLVSRTGDHSFLFHHRGEEVHVRRTVFGQHVIAAAYGEELELDVVSLPELVV